MLSVEFIPNSSRLLCVSHGAEEWYMKLGRAETNHFGICGDDCLWILGSDGTIKVFSFSQRKQINRIEVGNGIRRKLVKGLPEGEVLWEEEENILATHHVVACHDNRHVIIIQRVGVQKTRMVSIDILAGKIAGENICPLDSYINTSVFQSPDGHITFNVYRNLTEEEKTEHGDRRAVGLVKIDKKCEIVEQGLLMADNYFGSRFCAPSPSGRYWVSADFSRIEIKKIQVPSTKRGIFGYKKEMKTYFGRSVNIWEAFPLRHVRSVVVRWFEESELPDKGFIDSSKDKAGPVPVRHKIYQKLSSDLEKNYINPLSGLTHKQLGASFAEFYKQFDWLDLVSQREDHHRNYSEFCKPQIPEFDRSILGWADEETFWMSFYESFARVDINGTLSPRILSYPSKSIVANKDGVRVEQDSRRITEIVEQDKSLSITYRERETVGSYAHAKHTDVYRRANINAEIFNPNNVSVELNDKNISWEVVEAPAEAINNPNRLARATSYLKKQMKYNVKLASLSEADCIQAIEDLTAQFDDALPQRAYEGEIKLAFKMGKKTLNEKTFFDHILKSCPNSAPALRQLITKYNACLSQYDYLYNNSTKGEEFLLTAATTLGLLNVNSMDVLKLYSEHIDPSHQYYFCTSTYPALIKKHGMTNGLLALGVYLMLFKTGNSAEPEQFWKKYGVKKGLQALKLNQAKSLFSSVIEQNSEKTLGELEAHSFLGKITPRLIDANDPWDQAFFKGI